jgi:Tfp pilus assembly protein PilX
MRVDRARSQGFALVTVLGLMAVIALLSAGALHDALFATQLGTSRQLQQRALALAEQGLARGMAQVAAQDQPVDIPLVQGEETTSGAPDQAMVQVRYLGATALPRGSSAGRIAAHHFEVESTVHTARGTRITLVQGVVRHLPAPAQPHPAALPAVVPDPS